MTLLSNGKLTNGPKLTLKPLIEGRPTAATLPGFAPNSAKKLEPSVPNGGNGADRQLWPSYVGLRHERAG